MSRRSARQAAVQVLFQIDLVQNNTDMAMAFVKAENDLTEAQEIFALSLVKGVTDHLEQINSIIKEITIEWELDRIAVVDRNIIRLALYEICFSHEVPPNVAVNEAIELGKVLSTADSGRFINGILGKVLANPNKYIPANIKTEV